VTIEQVRTYWDRRPCNVRHSQIDVNQRPRAYSEAVTRRKYLVEPHIPGFVEFERWHGKWVLELGCGIGTDTIQFARVGVRVIAVDLSPTSLEIARKRAASHWEIANAVAFVEGDIERLEDAVKPAVFDLVYSFGVIHHTPDPGRALRRVKSTWGQTACSS